MRRGVACRAPLRPGGRAASRRDGAAPPPRRRRPAPRPPSRPTSGPVILFLGTSLTAGYGLDPDEAFPALIQAKLDEAGLRVPGGERGGERRDVGRRLAAARLAAAAAGGGAVVETGAQRRSARPGSRPRRGRTSRRSSTAPGARCRRPSWCSWAWRRCRTTARTTGGASAPSTRSSPEGTGRRSCRSCSTAWPASRPEPGGRHPSHGRGPRAGGGDSLEDPTALVGFLERSPGNPERGRPPRSGRPRAWAPRSPRVRRSGRSRAPTPRRPAPSA